MIDRLRPLDGNRLAGLERRNVDRSCARALTARAILQLNLIVRSSFRRIQFDVSVRDARNEVDENQNQNRTEPSLHPLTISRCCNSLPFPHRRARTRARRSNRSPAFVGRQIAATATQPIYASMLHGSVLDEDSGPVASYRMLVQSIVWAAGNFLAGPLVDLDGGRFRVLLGASATLMSLAAILGAISYPKAVVS